MCKETYTGSTTGNQTVTRLNCNSFTLNFLIVAMIILLMLKSCSMLLFEVSSDIYFKRNSFRFPTARKATQIQFRKEKSYTERTVTGNTIEI